MYKGTLGLLIRFVVAARVNGPLGCHNAERDPQYHAQPHQQNHLQHAKQRQEEYIRRLCEHVTRGQIIRRAKGDQSRSVFEAGPPDKSVANVPSNDPDQHKNGKKHVTHCCGAHVLGQLGDTQTNVCRVHQHQDHETHIVEARHIRATDKQEGHDVMRKHLPEVRAAFFQIDDKHLVNVVACFPQIHCLRERIRRRDGVSQP